MIQAGTKMKNRGLIAYLTSDGSSMWDWGKYSTPTFQSPAGNFQVHFYWNSVTDEVDYSYDYKAKFSGGDGYGGEVTAYQGGF